MKPGNWLSADGCMRKLWPQDIDFRKNAVLLQLLEHSGTAAYLTSLAKHAMLKICTQQSKNNTKVIWSSLLTQQPLASHVTCVREPKTI